MCMNEVCFVCLFHMLMREQMILTILIIAVALGAVTELHVGVVRVGDAADGAFMKISLFFFYIPRGLFKIDGLAGMLVLDPAKDAGGVLPEEKKKIGDGH